MTDRQIDNKVKKIQELETEIAELEQAIEQLKGLLKADMTEKDTDEIKTSNFTIRWKEVVSNRFDASTLKKDMPDLYKAFLKTSVSKRFTIA